jgi:hypothetical protein
MAFDEPIATCVALVIKPNDERYGHIGAISYHDWRESGDIGIRFADGEEGVYNDGNGIPPEAQIFSRKRGFPGYMFDLEGVGPKSLEEEVLRLGQMTTEQLHRDFEKLYGITLDTHPDPTL